MSVGNQLDHLSPSVWIIQVVVVLQRHDTHPDTSSNSTIEKMKERYYAQRRHPDFGIRERSVRGVVEMGDGF